MVLRGAVSASVGIATGKAMLLLTLMLARPAYVSALLYEANIPVCVLLEVNAVC